MNNRTLDRLRNSLNGKIYLYLKNDETVKRFAREAEAEGYRFGTISPADSPADEIVALCGNRQLAHVGFVGRTAIQCGGSGAKGRFHLIDYAKYKRGDKNFDFVR